jgi:AI-2 transport protein TqsA
MAASLPSKISIVVAAAVPIAAYQAASVFAPLVLAIFIIAIVWPLQSRLQLRVPKLLALAITLIITVAVCIAFASLAVWAFGRVGYFLVANSERYQALYQSLVRWLDDHRVSVAGLGAGSDGYNTQSSDRPVFTTVRFSTET